MKRMVLHWIRRTGASLCFIGYVPFAPGTVGSLAVLALLWVFRDTVGGYFLPQNAAAFLLAYIVFLAVAIFCANDAKEIFGSDDPRPVVIDECAGMVITYFLHPLSIYTLLLGFFLFRFYDIVKPYPVYKFEEIEDGVGIVMDDVAAGVLSNCTLFLIVWFYHAVKARL
jgi:phosphatidylglycerophosphatase A